FQAEDGIRDRTVTGVQTCALPSSASLRQRAIKRERVRSLNAFQLVASSSIESPPNFSIAASARTIETMASPTTAAAGTAQTSLRSIVAGLSVMFDRSTERSGFISVEIGFM